jgi:hypothetical protein
MYFLNGAYVPFITLKFASTNRTDANFIKGIKIDVTNKGDGKVLFYNADTQAIEFKTVDDNTIDGINVDTSNKANNRVLAYDSESETIIFKTISGGGSSFDQDLNTTDDVTFNNLVVSNNAGVDGQLMADTLSGNNGTYTGTLDVHHLNITGDAAGIFPTQTGHSGQFLTTNGTTTSWAATGGGGGGDSFDQSLNTTDQVAFDLVQTPTLVFGAGEESIVSFNSDQETFQFGSGIYTPGIAFVGGVESCGGAGVSYLHNISALIMKGADEDPAGVLNMNGGDILDAININNLNGGEDVNVIGDTYTNIMLIGNNNHFSDALAPASAEFDFSRQSVVDGYGVSFQDTNGEQYVFEFDNNESITGGTYGVTIGGTLAETVTNFKIAVEANSPFTVNINEDGTTGSVAQNVEGAFGNTNIEGNFSCTDCIFGTVFQGGTDDPNNAFGFGFGLNVNNKTITIGAHDTCLKIDNNAEKFTMDNGNLYVTEGRLFLGQDDDPNNYAQVYGNGSTISVQAIGGDAEIINSYCEVELSSEEDDQGNTYGLLYFDTTEASFNTMQLKASRVDIGDNTVNGRNTFVFGDNNTTGSDGTPAQATLTFTSIPTNGQTVTIEVLKAAGATTTYTLEFDDDMSVTEGNIPVTIAGSSSAQANNFLDALSEGNVPLGYGVDGSIVQLTQNFTGTDGNTSISSDYFGSSSFSGGLNPLVNIYSIGTGQDNQVENTLKIGIDDVNLTFNGNNSLIEVGGTLHFDSAYIGLNNEDNTTFIASGEGGVDLYMSTTNNFIVQSASIQMGGGNNLNGPNNLVAIGFNNSTNRSAASAILNFDFTAGSISNGDYVTFQAGAVELSNNYEFTNGVRSIDGSIIVRIGTTGYDANNTTTNFFEMFQAGPGFEITATQTGPTTILFTQANGTAGNTAFTGNLNGGFFPSAFTNGDVDNGATASCDFGIGGTITEGDTIGFTATSGNVYNFYFTNVGTHTDGIQVAIAGTYSAANTKFAFLNAHNYQSQDAVFNVDIGGNLLTQVYQGESGNTEVVGTLAGTIFETQFHDGSDIGTYMTAFGKGLTVSVDNSSRFGVDANYIEALGDTNTLNLHATHINVSPGITINNTLHESTPLESGWLIQKENSELVWGYNVNPDNDEIDNKSNAAFKLGFQGTAGYNGLQIQGVDAGEEATTWDNHQTLLNLGVDGQLEISGPLGTHAAAPPSIVEGDVHKMFFWLRDDESGFAPMVTTVDAMGTVVDHTLLSDGDFLVGPDTNNNLTIGNDNTVGHEPAQGAASFNFGSQTVVDGDTIVLTDTNGNVYTFEFDDNSSVSGGNIPITIFNDGGYSAMFTSQNFYNEITTNYSSHFIVFLESNVGPSGTLAQAVYGAAGNRSLSGTLANNVFAPTFIEGADISENQYAFGFGITSNIDNSVVVGTVDAQVLCRTTGEDPAIDLIAPAVNASGIINAAWFNATNYFSIGGVQGYTGSFQSGDGMLVEVVGGIITNVSSPG